MVQSLQVSPLPLGDAVLSTRVLSVSRGCCPLSLQIHEHHSNNWGLNNYCMFLNLPKDNTLFNFMREGMLGLYHAIKKKKNKLHVFHCRMSSNCPYIPAFLSHWCWLSCDIKKSSYRVHQGLLQSCSWTAFWVELHTHLVPFTCTGVSKLGFSIVHIVLPCVLHFHDLVYPLYTFLLKAKSRQI